MGDDAATDGFAGVERVVADQLRFKARLAIGEDAYLTLKLKSLLQEMWDVGGAAMSGAKVAGSAYVATTFFSSTASGGLWSLIGLGTAAATPAGWVMAAALASGAGYYGVTRAFRGAGGSHVIEIPRFINTPIDLLGMRLFDLIGTLAHRVATIDGVFDSSERAAIVHHLTREWGFDSAYVARALDVIATQPQPETVKEMARSLAQFQVANPDCNPVAMRGELMAFLRDLIEADGVIDEREELALEAIDAILRQETSAMKRIGSGAAMLGSKAQAAVGGVAGKLTSSVASSRLAAWLRPEPD